MTTILYKLLRCVRGLVFIVAMLLMAIPAQAQLFIQKPGLVTLTPTNVIGITVGADINIAPTNSIIVSSAAVNTQTNVGGFTTTTSATFTNTADTAAYAANDIVCDLNTNAMVFAAGRVNGGSGYITGVKVCCNNPTNANTFRLWIYDAVPSTMPADNAQYTLLWANLGSRIGYIDVGPLAKRGTGSDASMAQNITDRLPFLTSGTNVLYGYLETLGAFTSKTNQIYKVTVTVDQN